jgi:hypothetical protein
MIYVVNTNSSIIKYAIDEGRRIGQALNLFDEESKQRLGFFVSK